MGKSKRISPPRWFHQFQLRRDVSFDNHIHEIVELLNRERAFRQSVIDGIRLIWDLRHLHREDVLLELFPDIVERLQIKLTPNPDPDDIATRVLRKMQESNKSIVFESTIKLDEKPQLTGFDKLKLPLPDDNDTVEIRRDTHADGNATSNFLNAAFGLQPSAAPKAGGMKALKGFKDIPMPTIDD